MLHKMRSGISVLAMAALLAACGGGGSGSSTGGATAVAPPPPTPTSTTCSLRMRQDFALAVLREWYLFPETLPANTDPSAFTTVDDYIDFLTATARGQGRDRFFTFLTSIQQENAFFSSGASAGFGVRLTIDSAAQRAFIAEAFEGAPALGAGIDRGTEILAVGETPATLRDVTALFASGGAAALSDALGPSTAGIARSFRIRDAAGTREVTVTKASFDLTAVSSRYGARILVDGTKRVGYLNLRTFISSADNQLRAAFADFRAQGVNEYVIDFRYNGGGLVSTAELIGDLLGANRSTNDVFSLTTFRPEKASENETRRFRTAAQSVTPTKIAFITTNATASASELVINSMASYLGDNQALVGANTSGKPVGQIALDRSACDDRIRVVAFSTQNSANQGFYYNGLAPIARQTCRAGDDITKPLGDPTEASTRAALDFLGGRTCTAIAGGQTSQSAGGRALLRSAKPGVAEREVPGLF
jgi:carboxyl-terminal processing protease